MISRREIAFLLMNILFTLGVFFGCFLFAFCMNFYRNEGSIISKIADEFPYVAFITTIAINIIILKSSNSLRPIMVILTIAEVVGIYSLIWWITKG